MVKTSILGNLAEEYKIDNTTIKIYDAAYINKTPEEIKKDTR